MKSPNSLETPNSYYLYKLVSKSTKSLDQVRTDIKTNLAQRRFAQAMQSVEQSAHLPMANATRGLGGRDNRPGMRPITIPPPPQPRAAHPATENPEAPKH